MNPTTVSAIGPYLILNRIARGGMGTVYLARHAETQQIVALKLLSPQVGQNAEFLARFRREVNVMLGLRHPNIVEVYDAGVGAGADSSDDNAYYIAMAYLPYGNLKKEIARYAISGEPFPIDRALEITRQIALALGYAHQRGLIHRDVKPSNILRAPGEHYVLTDFGIVLDLDATRLTRDPTASGIGTPEYMSPEQIEHRQTDARSDVYALGVVLYELIAGVAPFKADSALVVLMKHVHEAPPPIAGYRADVPRAVCKVLEKALAKDPNQRYSSANAVAMALQGLLEPHANRALGLHLPPLQIAVPNHFKRLRWVGVVVVMLLLIGAAVVIRRPNPIHNTLVQPPRQVRFIANGGAAIVYMRPNVASPEVARLTPDGLSEVIGRSADDRWLLLKLNTAQPTQGWVQLADGHLRQGTLQALPHVPLPIREEKTP